MMGDSGHSCHRVENLHSFADDDFVITGISGRFPLADNVEELKENLYNKRNCIIRAEERWSSELEGFSNNYVGTIKALDKFDAAFFNMNSASANMENPQARILNEVCYEAIVDSGYDPKELSGKNIGVFIGQSDADFAHAALNVGIGVYDAKAAVGLITCMVPNKVAYRYDCRGPSFSIDSACSSSASAIEEAFRRIKDGTIEGAIVGGATLCCHPKTSQSYSDLGIYSITGETRSYDAKAAGIAKGEASVVIFIQKKKDARRIYAKVHNIECCTAVYQSEGNFAPSLEDQLRLYKKTYEGVGFDPVLVDYVEGNGTSTPEADEVEVNSIDEVFCKNRKTPLLLGTVKSNIGHTKAASALVSIAKVILAFENGSMAANIQHETPNQNCPSLQNGKIKVVTEAVPYDKSFAAINSFGLAGALAHMILQRNEIEKSPDHEEGTEKIPKLVVYAATTEKALIDMFTHFHQNSMPKEFYTLLNKSAYSPILISPYRGFAIMRKDASPLTSVEHISPVKRQVWYVVTGMGCQWPGMGLDLMQVKVFAESMRRSAKILEPFGIDLLDLLDPNKDFLLKDRHITPAFVTIVAIQIALVDVLRALGLEPDGIIGHSTGEIVCSYADGCCTAEQTILSAYYRGVSVENTDLPRGSMAAVGLTWEESKKRCPEGVYPACHNAEDSVTISGSKEAVETFVEQLKSENIFARVVNAYGYAFHCKSIQAVTGTLRNSLEKVYQNPKVRSKRWISTSYCEHEWNEPGCQFADANYFCHNLESEVHFREVLTHTPADAIIVEIGPHFLLKSVVSRAVGTKVSYIGLMKRNTNNVEFLLSSIGKLYNLGLDPQVENLYGPVSYPVPRGTPMISPLIQWDHSESFRVCKYSPRTAGDRRYIVNTISTDSFLLDHCIEGRSLYPATGYIYLAWKALSETLNKPMGDVPICIENFKINRATIISSKDTKTFDVRILKNSGEFEISEGGSIVVTGKIHAPKVPMFEDSNNCFKPQETSVTISGSEIYNELKIHGYEYGPAFQGLLEVNIEGTHGLVKWNEQWIPFLDSLLLFFGIIYEHSEFKLPTGALSIKIDPRIHKEFVSGMQEHGLKGIPVTYDRDGSKCTTPGVEIRNLRLDPAPHRSSSEIVPVLEEYSFVPYYEECSLESEEKTKCVSYKQECFHVAKQIIQRLNINGKIESAFQNIKCSDNIEKKEYLHAADENCTLLHCLRDVFELSMSPKLGTQIQVRCQNISNILSQDMLFKAVLSEKPLKTLLDVAMENCSGKINITEWCDYGPVILTTVQYLMKFSTQTKTNYTVIHSHAATVDAESLCQRDIQVRGIGENDNIPSNFNCSSHIVVTSFLLGDRNSLGSCIRKVDALTKEGGFILFIHKHELTPPELVIQTLSKTGLSVQPATEIEQYFSKQNLLIVSKKSYSYGVNVYLIRKPVRRADDSKVHVVRVLDTDYDLWVDELKQVMQELQERDSTGLALLVAQGSLTNGIIGMVNCLKKEPGGDKIRCIFTDRSTPQFDLNENFYSDVLEKDLCMNVYMNGFWGSFRHTTLNEDTPQELMDFAYVECTKIGDLSSLQWLESPIKRTAQQLDKDEIYQVYYSSLNFKDVMTATGKLSTESFKEGGYRTDVMFLGMEFAGRDKNGRRVMAMAGGGALCNTYVGAVSVVSEIPDHWSLEEAATVPAVYITCYLALIVRGELQYGEKILIHSGTGGIGQAAIRIALSLDCEIFTTVGTPEKREFLTKMFPQLKPENIGSSRNTTFEEMVLRRTQGKGVDVVLNSLADDKFQASLRCLGFHGRFLEIGKYDLQQDSPLALQIFQKGISFFGVQFDTYFERTTEASARIFENTKELLYDGIRKGVVQPLGTTVFSKDEVEKAFRFMGSGKHIGKVLIKVREEESEKLTVPLPVKFKAYRSLGLYDSKSYIIVGGLGGFGIELAKWLIQKGAGTVVLTSRYGARTPYHHLCLKRWKDSGARVIVSTLNVTKRDDAKKLLKGISTTCGPVGGIFNSAVVLKDAFIENQSTSDFEEVCAPKALATKYLDELSRSMCPELDMFVCFSSISCGKGNAGQSNYGYANSVMERICEKRRKDGLHGLAIQWGIIGDVGLVHRHMGDDAMIAGVMAQKIKSCLRTLGKLLLQDKAVVSSFVTADKSRMKRKSDDVLAQVAKLFGVPDIEQMNPYRTFGEMGIDSMVGVEVKQLLESSFDTTFTLQAIQEMKIDDVKRLVEEKENHKDSEGSQMQDIKTISLNSEKVSLPEGAVIALNNVENGTPLFLVHSNDFLHGNLRKLCERIYHQVFALQCTKDTPVNSLKDMSLWYLKQIQKACPDGVVHLASVSSAGNLALEMIVQSEKDKGETLDIKSLTILDGSLDLMEAINVTEEEKTKNAAVCEAFDLCEFLSMFADTDLAQLRTQLERLPTLESRLDTISSLTSGNNSALALAAESYARKQSLMRSSLPSGKIQKDLTAIEAAEKVLPNDISVLKSSLAEICDGRITIHRIVGNQEFLTGESSACEVAHLLNKLYE